jgi:hypothetical protein
VRPRVVSSSFESSKQLHVSFTHTHLRTGLEPKASLAIFFNKPYTLTRIMIVVYCTYLLHLVSFSSFLGWPRYAHCYLQTLWSNERSLIISSRELQYWGVKNNFSGKLKRFKNLALAFGHILQYTHILWPGLWSSFTAHICFILCHSWVDHVIWNTSICELNGSPTEC